MIGMVDQVKEEQACCSNIIFLIEISYCRMTDATMLYKYTTYSHSQYLISNKYKVVFLDD